MEKNITIEGQIESIIFSNPDNGYTVFSVSTENDVNNVCVGNISTITVGENIKIVGTIVNHPSYGTQIKIISYEKTLPSSEKNIEKYLASGLVKGIGPKLAERIVEKFGQDTLLIIEQAPTELSKIKGISNKKALEISETFGEQIELRRIVMYLQEYNISTAYAVKIHKRYKNRGIEIIQENPYVLSEDIFGIGFKTADSIAMRLGVDINSEFRIRSGIRYVLGQYVNTGSVCIEKDILINKSKELLNVEPSLIENIITTLQIEKTIMQENIDNKTLVYLNRYYYAENYVAKKLLDLLDHACPILPKKIEEAIILAENEANINLATKQKEAAKQALKESVLVITGGPGTGKTTTINTIISLLKQQDLNVELAAPTGRAAKRMSVACGIEAKTIHRLLGINFLTEGQQSFEKNADNPLEIDAIIIDETSMVDLMLMHHLLKAIPLGTKLILVGDSNQLPSVGAGNVLKDIIHSNLIPIVCLDEVFRQASESAIITNAHKINKGQYPILDNSSDCFFLKRSNVEDVRTAIKDLATIRLVGYKELEKDDIQIITPMKNYSLGSIELNEILQNAINPKSNTKQEYLYRGTIFREGDKVMQIKNNYNIEWAIYDNNQKIDFGLGVFNGDEGVIQNINLTNDVLTVAFYDKKIVKYDFQALEELSLSYAITVHKSQGSEYKAVIIPIFSGPPMLLNRNLIYTALTRAKKLVVFVGLEETLKRTIDNDKEDDRLSFLAYRLNKIGNYKASGPTKETIE